MADNLGQSGVLQVIPEGQLQAQDAARAQAGAAAQDAAKGAQAQNPQQLAGYIKSQFEIFRNHRNTAGGWSERLLAALRTFNGQYDPAKLQLIKQYGGSDVFARIGAQKARAASSLLRDIYLGQDQPWALSPPADPQVPQDISQKIDQLMQHEQQMIQQQLGSPPDPSDVEKRRTALQEAARDAAKKKASRQARDSEDKVEGILREGGWYHAMAEFLVDLPIFPFAVIKGPVVKVIPTVTWPQGGGKPEIKQTPTLTWNRVAPFDLWFTPGVADIENANVIEKLRMTRAEINDLLDLPGYDQEQVRMVLDEYGAGGLYDNWDTTDAERATLESRENPAWNRSGMISVMEFNGNVQGRLLQDYGLAVPDELRDYHVQAWVIGTHVVKCHLSPSPRQRHPYFMTSFEKVPGTPVGNGLLDLIADIQEVANSTLRSLVNNVAMASGPQVVINDERLSPGETGETMFPWKRWHTSSDPVGNNSQPPIAFFMPTSNAQQMMEVFDKFITIADDVSAIPKYVGGSGAGGGAGRTASGLAMLMGNASKILQTVSANIDRDVVETSLLGLVDLILLTDTSGLLTGEEKISVLGVNVAIQRETQRQRQIEFLQATMNPTDQKIMGLSGRATVLRAVSRDIGLNGEKVVPDEEVIEKMVQDEKAQAAQGNGAIEAKVEEGVQAGVKAGVARIATELTAGVLATRADMGEGPPAHIGTPGNMAPPVTNNPATDLGHGQGQGSPHTNNALMDLGPGGDSARRAAQGQGNQPSRISGHQMGPTTHVVGNQPGPNAKPVHGGVG